MEIPTEEIIERLENIIPKDIDFGQGTKISVNLKRDTVKLIKAQALEIRELQAGIVRLREENQKQYQENQK
tara:strand:+ start:110 stop:322 length:213 start_codon:yes stop_codon:yes gene_type:complete